MHVCVCACSLMKNLRMATLLHCLTVEFPAVLLDLQTGKILDEFQQYVLPRDHPKLSDFCKHLTGISQVGLYVSSVRLERNI